MNKWNEFVGYTAVSIFNVNDNALNIKSICEELNFCAPIQFADGVNRGYFATALRICK